MIIVSIDAIEPRFIVRMNLCQVDRLIHSIPAPYSRGTMAMVSTIVTARHTKVPRPARAARAGVAAKQPGSQAARHLFIPREAIATRNLPSGSHVSVSQMKTSPLSHAQERPSSSRNSTAQICPAARRRRVRRTRRVEALRGDPNARAACV